MDDMTKDKGRQALQDRLMQLMADETEIVRALEDPEASFFWPACRVGTAFWKSMDSRCRTSWMFKPQYVVTLSARRCAFALWGRPTTAATLS